MRRVVWIAAVVAVVSAGASLVPESPKHWILFKDKGVVSVRAALSERIHSLHPSTIQRWARAGWRGDEGDLNVSQGYMGQIEAMGIRVLRKSRWLNAVSAQLTPDQHQNVVGLPFVTGTQPVATYRRPIEPVETSALDLESLASTKHKFKYGASFHQWDMVQVPSMHDKGFEGDGVTICMMDSGFRKDHEAFRSSEIGDEWDFVFNDGNTQDEPNDEWNAQGHGTSTWSLVGGRKDGRLVGAALKARFLLAKTEDIRSETVVEEDNWVAALEWADERGVDIVSSSVGYSDWYTPENMDGKTAVTSKVASMAAKRGILVVNSAGNSGPSERTLLAPADAFGILAVGALIPSGSIAFFSSRGPTADGRTKPDVSAQGVSVVVAGSGSKTSYVRGSGTSFSCPITAGAVALLLSARRDWSPAQLREAVTNTATRATRPDSTYGWGTPRIVVAYNYLPEGALEIDHKPLGNQAASADGYTVWAVIRAYSGLAESQCLVFYRTSMSGRFTQLVMTRVAGGIFTATITKQPAGTIVQYYLQARDTLNKSRRRPYEAPRELYSFDIRG